MRAWFRLSMVVVLLASVRPTKPPALALVLMPELRSVLALTSRLPRAKSWVFGPT